MVKATIKASGADSLAALRQKLAELAKKEVLVGIPEDKAQRENSDPINNAELLYIHTHGVRRAAMRKEMQKNIDGGLKYSEAHSLYLREHGSPLWQVPPRPVLEPAIESKKEEIAQHLAAASKAALDGNPRGAKAALNDAGLLGAETAQGWFENPQNGWPPNAPKTDEKKLLKTRGKLGDDLRRHYADTGTLSDVTGLEGMTIPLVDTGQLRKAITYVIRDKDEGSS